MAFRHSHRKLIEQSIDLNKTHICDFICATNKLDGICPTPCFSVCPSTCYRSITLLQFPPTSLPDTNPNPNPNPNPHHKTNLHLYLPFSFALLAAALFLFASFYIYKHFRNRRSSTSPETQGENDRDEEFVDEEHGHVIDHPIWYIRTVGLEPSIINAISVFKFKKSDGLVEGTDCSVCLSEFEEDETLRLLPKCNHAFHIPCIDTWLQSHTNCPNCRALIFSPPIPPSPVAAQETIRVESVSESAVLDIENEIGEEGDGDFERIRRSVSASIIMSAGAAMGDDYYPVEFDANSNTQMENSVVVRKMKVSPMMIRLMSPSVRPCLAKRSFSCSGKVFLSRYCPNNRISNLPC